MPFARLIGVVFALLVVRIAREEEPITDYVTLSNPILIRHCAGCHGAKKQEAEATRG